MTSVHAKLISKAAVFGLALPLLAGCHTHMPSQGPESAATGAESAAPVEDGYATQLFHSAKWQQSQDASANLVEVVSFSHGVSFERSRDRLSEAERGKLLDFAQEIKVVASDRIVIDGPRTVGQRLDPVTVARIDALRQELAAFGLPSEAAREPIAQTAETEVSRDRLVVLVTRAIVIPPDCAQPQPRSGERPQFALGCANTANLGLMIADPNDLRQGRPLGPADGDAATLSIQRYRRGEVTPLEEVVTGN